MAIERTLADEQRVITPKVITNELKIGDTVVTKIIQSITDDLDGIVVGAALSDWMTNLEQQITLALTNFENFIIAGAYTHPNTHPADMITETVSRVWFTPAERTKLQGVAVGANNYSHPTTHSASMIDETATRIFFTPGERTKLQGIQTGANNYVHPATHPATIITDLWTPEGFIRPELIAGLNVQRITSRQSILTEWNYAALGYSNVGGPSCSFIGSNTFTIGASPTQLFVATIANGFNGDIGNVDSIVVIDSVIASPTIESYGYDGLVYILLNSTGELSLTQTVPIFDPITMKSTPENTICLGCGWAANNLFIDPVSIDPNNITYKGIIGLITPTKGFSYTTEWFNSTALGGTAFFNRLMTKDMIFQVYCQIEGSTDWNLIDNKAYVATDPVPFVVASIGAPGETIGFYGQIMSLLKMPWTHTEQIRFKFNALRMY